MKEEDHVLPFLNGSRHNDSVGTGSVPTSGPPNRSSQKEFLHGGTRMNIRFQTPHQYVFIHRHVKHLLLLWKKEHKRDLYIVDDETESSLVLRYPGDTYAEMVLQEVEPIFFQRLETDEEAFLAILAATLDYGGRLMAMYVHPERPQSDVYFFEVRDEQIEEIADDEYPRIIQAFMEEYPDSFA
jgi:hypothetical protein